MDKLKKTLVAAVSSSIALVCMLLVSVLSATKGTKSEIGMIVLLIAILLLTVSTIAQWVRYFKGYVEFAIEQKLKDTNKETKNNL